MNTIQNGCVTPKQKAKELIERHWIYALPNLDGSWQNAKKSAIITTEEAIQTLSDIIEELDIVQDVEGKISYWIDVQTEINKL